jgi:hypothetical protein
MFKTIGLLILCLLLCFSTSFQQCQRCRSLAQAEYVKVREDKTLIGARAMPNVICRYCYRTLNNYEQEMYKKLPK